EHGLLPREQELSYSLDRQCLSIAKHLIEHHRLTPHYGERMQNYSIHLFWEKLSATNPDSTISPAYKL
ncbi:MAG: hypothetical protein M3R00_02780, partial [Pseudomonadota bacterium]|nr:hypothetical protein [Pseudomonadota bacterium]